MRIRPIAKNAKTTTIPVIKSISCRKSMRKIPPITMPAKPNLPKSSNSRPVSSLRVVSFLKVTRRFFGFFMPPILHGRGVWLEKYYVCHGFSVTKNPPWHSIKRLFAILTPIGETAMAKPNADLPGKAMTWWLRVS